MKHVETITLPHDLSEFTEIIDVRSPSEFAEDHLPVSGQPAGARRRRTSHGRNHL